VFHYVKRTNKVKQSKLTAIFSGMLALLHSILLITRKLWKTTHFVANGPGTCVPFFYVFYIMKRLKLSRVKLIFFESWCRVRDLSLSGKLVKPIVDEFIVQWP
jgi:beta-1,4-N-acetylglucosaminyltransferase